MLRLGYKYILIHVIKLYCPQCKANSIVKNGMIKNRQRFLCKICNYQFTFHDKNAPKIKNASLKRRALHLLLEGIALREIARMLQIAPSTLSNWKKQWNKSYIKFLIRKTSPVELDYKNSIHYLEKRRSHQAYNILWIDMETDVSLMSNCLIRK
jgi:transposase-like protein